MEGSMRLLMFWILLLGLAQAQDRKEPPAGAQIEDLQGVPPPPSDIPGPQSEAPTLSVGDGTMKGSLLSPYDNAFLVTQ
jgi:hypothetical protein